MQLHPAAPLCPLPSPLAAAPRQSPAPALVAALEQEQAPRHRRCQAKRLLLLVRAHLLHPPCLACNQHPQPDTHTPVARLAPNNSAEAARISAAQLMGEYLSPSWLSKLAAHLGIKPAALTAAAKKSKKQGGGGSASAQTAAAAWNQAGKQDTERFLKRSEPDEFGGEDDSANSKPTKIVRPLLSLVVVVVVVAVSVCLFNGPLVPCPHPCGVRVLCAVAARHGDLLPTSDWQS